MLYGIEGTLRANISADKGDIHMYRFFSPVLSNEKRRMQDGQLCWALAIFGLLRCALLPYLRYRGFPLI